MTRYVLTINVKDDPAAIQTYRDCHRQVWPEVLDSLRRVGVEGMDIHMLGRRLVMILDLSDGLDFRRVFAAHSSSSPRVAEWEHLMKSLQEPSPDATEGEWWAVMEPVFRLDSDERGGVHSADRTRP